MDLPGNNRYDGVFLVFILRERLSTEQAGNLKIEVDMKAKQERTGLLVDASLSTFRESNALSKIWHYSS
jgi:hypothetical protein